MVPDGEVILRILVAALLAGAIGYEREFHGKPAGLRTHALVGIGAAIFTLASIIGFDSPDESRVAAQIVTGVGFLGAGAIFRDGSAVAGLTTAAGLWTAAAIGMSAGSGRYLLATMGALVTLGVLFGLVAIDDWVRRQQAKVPSHIELILDSPERVAAVVKFSQRIDSTIKQLGLERNPDETAILTCSVEAEKAKLAVDMLSVVKGVTGARIVPALEKRRYPSE